ncbi:hypothetical protein IV203_020413 [Nitzschia inconspicua]|uniref:Uncharacterized protein n=1 Tax=Nitzschia inconspicua TaxID=303405 RepID=A0A9K3PA21_9STRA|nr:hypothetical protein IV203_020413 [Nitzschia inconspicua]
MRKTNISENQQTSLEAKLLLHLKVFGIGVPPMLLLITSRCPGHLPESAVSIFDSAIKSIYMDEWLRLPTAEDLKAILKLHKTVLTLTEWGESLDDCSHTYWRTVQLLGRILPGKREAAIHCS